MVRVDAFEERYGVTLAGSITRSVGDLEERYCEFGDYASALVDAGVIATTDDLLKRSDLLLEIFYHWVRQGRASSPSGCRFAKRLARDPERWGWLSAVWTEPPDDERLPPVLNQVLYSARHREAVLVLLPQVATVESWGRLIGNLVTDVRWSWETIDVSQKDKPEEQDAAALDDTHLVIGLRWDSPHADKPAWPLAFGPIEDFPVTRRAPVPALVMRTHDPLPDSAGVDLAAMEDGLPNENARKKFRIRSGEHKAANLDGELTHAARARATLRLPRDVVESWLRPLDSG